MIESDHTSKSARNAAPSPRAAFRLLASCGGPALLFWALKLRSVRDPVRVTYPSQSIRERDYDKH